MCVSDEVKRDFPLLSKIQRHFRTGRMDTFLKLFNVNDQSTILDVGGDPYFWMDSPVRCKIVCLNLYHTQSDRPNIETMVYDGKDIPFSEASFDIVFSNSVIEHVGDFLAQKKLAGEISRVGKHYWVQVPNYYFFWEPHAFLPFFQFMPPNIKMLLSKISRSPYPLDELLSIRLLTTRELKYLFPGGRIYKERFLGLSKSICVYK